jgi:raffinose/stachyose/melibiose transport system substrate-binding protein
MNNQFRRKEVMNAQPRYLKIFFITVCLLTLFTQACTGTTATTVSPPTSVPATQASQPTEPPQVATEAVVVAPTEVPPTEIPATQAEPVSLSLYWWGEEGLGHEDWVNTTLKRYSELHPNVKVDVVFQGTDEVVPNFVAAAEANKGPDMATLWYGMYQNEDIWAGHMAPISDYTSEEEMSHWMTKQLNTFDNKVWAIDMYSQAHVISYNKQMFAKAGLDPEKPPATWAELLNACKALKTAGFIPIGFGIADGWQGTQFTNMILPQTLENYIKDVPAAVVGERNWTEQAFAEPFYKMAELRDAGCMNVDAGSLTYYEGQGLLLQGKAAMTIHASDAALAAAREMGEDVIGIMPTISLDDTPENWAPFITEAWVIPSWSPNKEIAADVLNFFHTQQAMQDGYTITKGAVLPGDDRFDASIITSPLAKKVWDLQLQGAQKKAYMIDGLLPWAVLDEGQIRAFGLMFSENLSPEKAAEMMEAAAKKWREANPEVLKKYQLWAQSLAQ